MDEIISKLRRINKSLSLTYKNWIDFEEGNAYENLKYIRKEIEPILSKKEIKKLINKEENINQGIA